MISKLLSLDPSKDCLRFLHDRVLAENYRGIQISQHNRYTIAQVIGMLEIFHSLVGEGKMKIRTTDLRKRPYNTPDEYVYAKYTSLVNNRYGKSTQDSIRKNLFVDFHRMGLIKRFGNDDKEVNPYGKRPVKSVALTPLSIELIKDDKTPLEKYMIFSRALDNLLLGLATDFFDLLAELEYIDVYEYTFFVSFLRQKLNDKFIGLDDVITLVKEYRAMSRFTRNEVVKIVQAYCNPDDFLGDKTNKRDFHNWMNETQQVFMLLNMTAYYQYNEGLKRIEFMVSPDHAFTSKDDVKKLKRSIVEKKEYFNKHNIEKRIGFELHHIIPLLWAKNINEFFLLDKWENMLYIDGGNHSIITQSGNRFVKVDFSSENNDIILSDATGNKIILKDNENVLYNYKFKGLITQKNNDLLTNL